MKRIFCLLLLIGFLQIFFLQTIKGQNNYHNVNGGAVQSVPMYLRDVFSTAVQPKGYAGIDGSPFLSDKWLAASVKFVGRKERDTMLVKLNLVDNKIHFQDEKGEELQCTIRTEEVKFIDTATSWSNATFRSNYAGGGTLFFEVLADGPRMQLINKVRMIKWETNAFGTETKRSWQLDEELFFYIGGFIYKKSKNCSTFNDAFGDDKAVLDFISTNHLRCDKKADMMKLANFVNSQ